MWNEIRHSKQYAYIPDERLEEVNRGSHNGMATTASLSGIANPPKMADRLIFIFTDRSRPEHCQNRMDKVGVHTLTLKLLTGNR